MSEFRREVVVRPAWDKRSKDPKKNYGIHGAELCFFLHGERGTVQFVVFTGWQLPEVAREMRDHPVAEAMGADVGYHSREPMYDGQEKMTDDCPILGGGICYYDGSGLQADELFARMVTEGHSVVWSTLEDRYRSNFECEDYGTHKAGPRETP